MVALEQQGRLCHVELGQQPAILGQTREGLATHSRAPKDEYAPRTLASTREEWPRVHIAGSWSLTGWLPTFPASSQPPEAPAACPVASRLDHLPAPPAPLQTPTLEGPSTLFLSDTRDAVNRWATPGRV